MKKPKIAIGIAGYGRQSPKFWLPLATVAGHLQHEGLDFDDIYFSGVSNPDINRNNVVKQFRQNSDADYLWWLDTDNPPQVGMASRLLSHNAPLVSGLYYAGDPDDADKMIAVAYVKNSIGRYHPINRVTTWEVGEVLDVDAVGAGCFMTHRSVYEEIEDNFVQVNRLTGGMSVLHKDDIKGKRGGAKFSTKTRMGKVYDGVLYDPVIEVPKDTPTSPFPFFICQWARTEDLMFCEMAKRIGHNILLDTACEIGHVKDKEITGRDWRRVAKIVPDVTPQEVVYAQGS